MNADLLAMLSGGGLGGMPGAGGANPAEESGTELLRFKAGRMKAELQQNGKFLISPDPRRGEIRLLWKANDAGGASNGHGGVLTLEWVDRRTTLPVTTLTVFPEDGVTYRRAWTGDGEGRGSDRVYLLQYGNASDRRFFFWMQELTDVRDGEYAASINAYCSDPAECAKKAREIGGNDSAAEDDGGAGGGAGGSVDSANLQAIMQGLTGGSAAPAAGAGGGSSGDALASIVQNLTSGAASSGAPPSATPAPTGASATPNAPPRPDGSAATAPGSAGAAGGGGGGGAITLADLQGAMQGLATSTPPGSAAAAGAGMPGPPLSELATADAIETSGILSDPAVRARLVELLPEGQRTDDKLEENLRSPQVQQSLKSLTAALASGDEFNSILANFALDPSDGAAAMASGNPIQAFLDCVLRKVEREKAAKEEEEEGKSGDNMEE